MKVEEILAKIRSDPQTPRDKGTDFERLCLVFLQYDTGMQQQYDKVWTYTGWAHAHGYSADEPGIDLVARLRNEDGFCAVQCKRYGAEKAIRTDGLDKLIGGMNTDNRFLRGLFITTSDREFTRQAQAKLGDNINVMRRDRIENSSIDWDSWIPTETPPQKKEKAPRDHQREAIAAVCEGLADVDRGKMIMACGTGKTYTALKIAENIAGKGGRVLVLVPSLALMSQMIREWSIDSPPKSLRSFAVCSDSQVGKRHRAATDLSPIEPSDLDFPATLSVGNIIRVASPPDTKRMTVIFATYQSLDKIKAAQAAGLPEFDLIVCDEAHRTTGVKWENKDESNFTIVHSNENIRANKRLYMTATPRIYTESAKKKAARSTKAVHVTSMDDEEKYGRTFYTLSFGAAVSKKLLSDYKVIVLTVNESELPTATRERTSNEWNVSDATKMIGCYKALLKSDLRVDVAGDEQPMVRALAFCNRIDRSKAIEREFASVVDDYIASESGRAALGLDKNAMDDMFGAGGVIKPEVQHVDGTYGAARRTELLQWLQEDHGERTCRILTNARCLSEGVDVPALDAVLFMHPRRSQIDVVQAVGRVMRQAKGKRMGYVILPIAVDPNVAPEAALDNNDRYQVIWQILNALRSHDERLDDAINRARYGADISDYIEIDSIGEPPMPPKDEQPQIGGDGEENGAGDGDGTGDASENQELSFIYDGLARAIMAKIVEKCGDRDYIDKWAKDIVEIAKEHIARIKRLIETPDSPARAAFDEFLGEIHDDINPEVSEEAAIEMLAQHAVTSPVFNALFSDYDFAGQNPVSQAMQKTLTTLEIGQADDAPDRLQPLYDSIARSVDGVDKAEAKQEIVRELYEVFFKTAFPKVVEQLGIVYTPVDVVDFIIHSVNDLLQSEFGQTLGSKGVHILDPFTGTGTFITRLLQLGLIKPDELAYKYHHEIHANEILLLAYYIAAVNIEACYHELKGSDYQRFEGICLTDTFQLNEDEGGLLSEIFPVNHERLDRQKSLDIRVIIGNPPYSAKQKSANDNATNIAYPKLDNKISETYVARSTATNKVALYDSYIRAIRWASDRIGDVGIVGYVTNSKWIDSNSADGLRQCLVEEYTNIYIFDLRGNINKDISSKGRCKEGQNIFGSATKTGVAIALFVKNPNAEKHGQIFYHDIGDDLKTQQKRDMLTRLKSMRGISESPNGWQTLTLDKHGDWLNQRDDLFESFIAIGDKKNKSPTVTFRNYSRGIATGRDAWCYNASRTELADNMQRMIATYNAEVDRFRTAHPNFKGKENDRAVSDFIDKDPSRVSWSVNLRDHLIKKKQLTFNEAALTPCLYRPFDKRWLYYDRRFIERVHQMPHIFPIGAGVENRVIAVTGTGAAVTLSALMTNTLPDLNIMAAGGQCFPRYLYCQATDGSLERRDAISEVGLRHFEAAYSDEKIGKEDIFYYIYGLLHSSEYCGRFANNLAKELPRIPCVKRVEDFWSFAKAGRALGDLHCGYESVEPYHVTIVEGDLRLLSFESAEAEQAYFRVEKRMDFAKARDRDGKQVKDKSKIIYNRNITIADIPLRAYEYVVNGQSAIEWVMSRQYRKPDKASGIVNDANMYAIETVGNPRYPLELLRRVISVSMQSLAIIEGLPKLDID